MKTMLVIMTAALVAAVPHVNAQTGRYATLDHLLDTYVRDGKVYYRALQKDRAQLDRHLRTLDVPAAEVASWPRAEQEVFWLNAYNALVLDTVIDHYPIHGTSTLYPPNSIRQISGAFERLTHRVAAQSLTLDAIEQKLLGDFGDARVVLALGRAALGGPRLRSEVYQADTLDAQLQEMVKECAARLACMALNRQTKVVTLTPLVGWHADAFEKTFAPAAGDRWPSRTPIERAVAAMLEPVVFPSERSVLDENTFRIEYGQFDWSLNDL